ncbi:MAG: efflux RND transporter periplasmic adaptor subunit [Deltaproteobacteria bacterium]|nr:efflux RND transporter periplasmic adaptor subunit [Deltaproteobacteria bacterium]
MLKKKYLNRTPVIAVLCGLTGFFTLFATASCSSGEKKNAAQSTGDNDTAKNVILYTVTTMDIMDKRAYAADLEASTEVTLYPLVAERIVSFPVEEGDRVRKGDMIAKIRAASIKKSIAQMQAEIEALDQDLMSQKRELERSSELYNKSVITEQTLEQMESGYMAGLARRKSLEASLGQVEITAGNAVMKSPVEGFIVDKRLEEGDVAQMAVPLCSIVQVDPIRVELGIIEKDLMAVRKGTEVELSVSAVPGRIFHGRIVRILPVLDRETRTNEAQIEIDNPVDEELGAPLLKPGMYGEVNLVIGRRENQVVVPSRVLMIAENASVDQRRVFVVDKNQIAHSRMVRVGIRNGDWFEIIEGLKTGERVVIKGQYNLRDGDSVSDEQKTPAAAAKKEDAR